MHDCATYEGRLEVKVGYQRVSGEKINIIVKSRTNSRLCFLIQCFLLTVLEVADMNDWEIDQSGCSTPSLRLGLAPALFYGRVAYRMEMKLVDDTLLPVDNGTVEL